MSRQNLEIDRQAADWAARGESDGLSAAEQATRDAWLAADIRHLGAYAKACAVLARLERTRAVGPGIGVLRPRATQPTRRAMVLTGGVAASLAAIAMSCGLAWELFGQKTFTTGLGETDVVPLEDGSVVTLNTNSEVAVRYSKARREIRLLRGEALFDVAKNKARPFVVLAGDTQVRAVGTSFVVRLLPEEPVQVLVREGVVEVKRPAIPEAALVQVAANGRATVPANAPITTAEVEPSELNRSLSWRVGRIAFDDQTLASASREFARYSDTHIVIDDPAIAARTVTGLFVSNDPVGFAKAVAVVLNLHAVVDDREVRLSR